MDDSRRLPRAVALAALSLLAGCSNPKPNGEDVRLLQLAGLLPGRYDNVAQVEADRRAGIPPHQPVRLAIAQIDSLTVGDHAFYLQLSDARDPQHILEQRVFSLQSGQGGILETVWALVEPARWRGAVNQPELLTALQYRDLKLQVGCSLLWKKTGDQFTAINDMTHCHATDPDARGAVFARWQMELGSDSLALSELAFDPDGKQIGGRTDDNFLRLRRTTD